MYIYGLMFRLVFIGLSLALRSHDRLKDSHLPPTINFWTPPSKNTFFGSPQEKKKNIWTEEKKYMVLVLLSAFVEIFSVSRMRYFHRIGPLSRFGLLVAMSIYIYIYVYIYISICPPERVFTINFVFRQSHSLGVTTVTN